MLTQFLTEKRANEIKETTLKGYTLTLTQFEASMNKPWKEASKQDVMKFFNDLQDRCKRKTVHTWKGRVKTFYNWLFELSYREYPACVKWMRVSNPRHLSKTKGLSLPLTPEQVLTPEDIKTIIGACDHPRDQALISVMYETACEPFEVLNMKVSSVMFDEDGGVVVLKGAMGSRRIRVVDSIPYLMAWLNVHPLRNTPEAPLWIVRRGKPEGLGYMGIWRLCKKLKRLTGLKKPLRPNYLRHAGLTFWAKILPEQKLKKLAGWSPSSRMASIYIHLSGKDLDDDILAAHGRKRKKPQELGPSLLAPRECPRCKFENTPTALFCVRCGMRQREMHTAEDHIVSHDQALEFIRGTVHAFREEMKSMRWKDRMLFKEAMADIFKMTEKEREEYEEHKQTIERFNKEISKRRKNRQ